MTTSHNHNVKLHVRPPLHLHVFPSCAFATDNPGARAISSLPPVRKSPSQCKRTIQATLYAVRIRLCARYTAGRRYSTTNQPSRPDPIQDLRMHSVTKASVYSRSHPCVGLSVPFPGRNSVWYFNSFLAFARCNLSPRGPLRSYRLTHPAFRHRFSRRQRPFLFLIQDTLPRFRAFNPFNPPQSHNVLQATECHRPGNCGSLHTHLQVHGYLLLFGAGSRCTPGPYLLHYRPQRHPRANQSRPQFIRRNLSISTSSSSSTPRRILPDNPKPTASTHAEPENSSPKAVSTHTCLRFSPFALAGRIPTATPCLISTPSTFSNNHLVSNPTPRRSTENRGWPPLLTIASPSQTRRKDGGRRRANLRASPHVHAPLKRSDPYPGIPNVSRLLLTTRTRRPATARPIAHAEPDTPPPTTTTRSSLRTLILAEISLPIVSNPARSAHRARPASLLLADAESTEDLIHQILPQVCPCDASECRHTLSHILGHQLVRPAGRAGDRGCERGCVCTRTHHRGRPGAGSDG